MTNTNPDRTNADGLFLEREFVLTETSEEVTVGKVAHIVEEITLRKETGERVETMHGTVRHIEVEVEPITSDPTVRR